MVVIAKTIEYGSNVKNEYGSNSKKQLTMVVKAKKTIEYGSNGLKWIW